VGGFSDFEEATVADQPHPHDDEETSPMGRDELDAPAMRARIQTAKQRAARGRIGDQGSTAEDLEELAREQRRLATRT
jgi:hypothetical protein